MACSLASLPERMGQHALPGCGLLATVSFPYGSRPVSGASGVQSVCLPPIQAAVSGLNDGDGHCTVIGLPQTAILLLDMMWNERSEYRAVRDHEGRMLAALAAHAAAATPAEVGDPPSMYAAESAALDLTARDMLNVLCDRQKFPV